MLFIYAIIIYAKPEKSHQTTTTSKFSQTITSQLELNDHAEPQQEIGLKTEPNTVKISAEKTEELANKSYNSHLKSKTSFPNKVTRAPVIGRSSSASFGEQSKVDAIISKMEKSMLKDQPKNQTKMRRKFEELIKSHIGGVRYRTDAKDEVPAMRVKIIVVAAKGAGFPVLAQFFNEETSFFQHGDPPHDAYTVANLLNCVLDPPTIVGFEERIGGEFGKTPYFRKECLLQSGAICTDPLSYEKACAKHNHQIIRSKNMSLEFANILLEENTDIKIIFLVRDPRASLKDKSLAEMKSICHKLHSDLKYSSHLESKHAGRFVVARYEVLAREPTTETENLAKALNITFAHTDTPLPHSEHSWSPVKNPMSKINKWKQKLNIKQIKKIETQCLDTLTRLEYPILAS